VLNRADSNVGIGRQDVAAIIGATPEVMIPSDRNVTRSVNRGEPIVLDAKRSDAAKAFHELAGLFEQDARDAGALPEVVKKSRRKLFRRGR